jgi:hypothetical protein
MRRSDLSQAVSLMLAAHASSSYAFVARNPTGSVFSIDIVPQKQPGDSLNTREAVAQSGSVLAKLNNAQTAFYSPVTIGDQTFKMILDTGSADL